MLYAMLNYINNPVMMLLYIIAIIFPLLFSIAFHEMAHGWVAYKFGDPTAKMMGRLTLNPFKHLDLVGTICMLVIGLGWAKPVIINIENIPSQNKQMLVALAGPVSNFFLALVFMLLMFLFAHILSAEIMRILVPFFDVIITINLGLAVFNLIPIPPMDGSKVLAWMLPENIKYKYLLLEPYGMFILILLLSFKGFSFVFVFANAMKNFMYGLMF